MRKYESVYCPCCVVLVFAAGNVGGIVTHLSVSSQVKSSAMTRLSRNTKSMRRTLWSSWWRRFVTFSERQDASVKLISPTTRWCRRSLVFLCLQNLRRRLKRLRPPRSRPPPLRLPALQRRRLPPRRPVLSARQSERLQTTSRRRGGLRPPNRPPPPSGKDGWMFVFNCLWWALLLRRDAQTSPHPKPVFLPLAEAPRCQQTLTWLTRPSQISVSERYSSVLDAWRIGRPDRNINSEYDK